MARPQREINWEIVDKMMEAGCSAKEIFGYLRISDSAFYSRFIQEYGEHYQEYKVGAYESGNALLRLTQFQKALRGNIEMLKLLGRERLGQGKEIDDKLEGLEKKFLQGMDQLLSELSERKIEDSNISNETKS